MLTDSNDQSLGSEEQFITRPMNNRSLSRGQVWTASLLIHQLATTLKPLTEAAMWITLIDSLQSDVLLENLGSTYPLSIWQWHSTKAVELPARRRALSHHKNCSGMAWGTQQRAQAIDQASSSPDPSQSRASTESIHSKAVTTRNPMTILWPCLDTHKCGTKSQTQEYVSFNPITVQNKSNLW